MNENSLSGSFKNGLSSRMQVIEMKVLNYADKLDRCSFTG